MLLAAIGKLAEKPENAAEILTQHLPFQLVGLLVVLTTLSVLFALCSLVGAGFRKADAAARARAARLAAVEPAPVLPADEITPQIVAAIAAAITVTLDRPHRLLDIQPAGHPVGMTSAWAIEGRFEQFSSHRVR